MYLVVGRQNCPFCEKAKLLLESKNLDYLYVDVTSGDCVKDSTWLSFLKEDLKAKTVPQVFKLLGGYDGLTDELFDGEVELNG